MADSVAVTCERQSINPLRESPLVEMSAENLCRFNPGRARSASSCEAVVALTFGNGHQVEPKVDTRSRALGSENGISNRCCFACMRRQVVAPFSSHSSC